MILKERILTELRTVTDPATSRDVVSIGLIKELSVTPENKVRLKLRPASPVCPLAFHLAIEIQERVRKIQEIKELEITVIDYQKAEELNKLLQDERD